MSAITTGGSLEDLATVADDACASPQEAESPSAQSPQKRARTSRRAAMSPPSSMQSADPFEFELDGRDLLPSGPATLLETFRWPLCVLREIGDDGRRMLLFWLQLGLCVKTHYSGMGCFDMAVSALRWSLQEHFCEAHVPPARYIEAADIASHCRSILQAEGGPGTVPEHTFGDLVDRLPTFVRLALRNLKMPDKQWLSSHTDEQIEARVLKIMGKRLDVLECDEAYRTMSCSWCYTLPRVPFGELAAELLGR